MNIYFDNVGSKKLQHLFSIACEHYGETLGLRSDLRRNMTITIEFISPSDEDEDCGFCYWEDRRNKPREFVVQLDVNRDVNDQLQDLAHEFVHIKQMARGELVDMSNGWAWKGEYVKQTGDKWKDYWYCPWEMEARAMERPMYMKFMEDFDPADETAKLLEGPEAISMNY